MTRAEAGSIGSAFDAFLEEEGIADDVSRIALKKVIAAAIERRMQELQLSKTAMARRMETSRAQMNRLLDPENDGITLNTIQRAAKVLGMRVRLELF
jgi:antitoxin HicB